MGRPSAANYIKRLRAQAEADGEPVLLVDVGDMFQGTPIGTKTEGRAVIDYFNAIGYDFAVPGNHDFDLGRDVAERMATESRFPWVACNLVEKDTGKVVDWCVPTLMIERAGIKIGVVGIITPGTKHMSFPENIKGLDFLPMAESIAKYRDELKRQGADLIFLAIHEGLPYDPQQGWAAIAGAEQTDAEMEQGHTHGANYSGGAPNLMELVNEVPGIDFAVGGHTHRGYQEPWIDPVNHTLCFESFGNGSSIGHAILLIDPETEQLVGWEPSHSQGTLITLFEDQFRADAEIAEVIRPYQEESERAMARQVGTAAVNLSRGGPGNSLMGNLVTDAMRTRFDADFSFQNMGGLRADLPSGPSPPATSSACCPSATSWWSSRWTAACCAASSNASWPATAAASASRASPWSSTRPGPTGTAWSPCWWAASPGIRTASTRPCAPTSCSRATAASISSPPSRPRPSCPRRCAPPRRWSGTSRSTTPCARASTAAGSR